MKTIRQPLPAVFYRVKVLNDILVTCILEYMFFKVVVVSLQFIEQLAYIDKLTFIIKKVLHI